MLVEFITYDWVCGESLKFTSAESRSFSGCRSLFTKTVVHKIFRSQRMASAMPVAPRLHRFSRSRWSWQPFSWFSDYEYLYKYYVRVHLYKRNYIQSTALFRLSSCSTGRDTRIEFVKDPRYFLLSHSSCRSSSFFPFSMNWKNKAAVDKGSRLLDSNSFIRYDKLW